MLARHRLSSPLLLLATALLVGYGCDNRRASLPDGSLADGGPSATDAGSLMCEVLADPTICWNSLVRDLYACVPREEVGELNAERTACTFSDGTVVEFAQPLPTRIEGPPAYRADFRVRTPEGAECGTFFDRGQERTVIVGVVSSSFLQEPGPRLSLFCMEGGVRTDIFNVPFDEVIDCAIDEGFAVPGWQASINETSISLAVVSEGNNSPDLLFECVTAGG